MPINRDDLEVKIDALYEAVKQLQIERDELNDSARKLREKRDQRNAEVRELVDKANEYRALRDKLNAQIKDHKRMRNEATHAAKLTREKMAEMGIDVKKLPRVRPEEEIKEEIQRIDWQIQTSVISIPKERKLVEKAEKLRKELEQSRELRKTLRQAGDRRIEIDALRISSSKLHSKILGLSKESQQNHQKMIEILGQVKVKRKEADSYHHQMLDVINKADLKHTEFLSVRKNLTNLMDKEHGLELRKEERRSFAAEKKLKKRAEEALEKLRAGEKVELDELMLLKEFNIM